MAVKEVLDRVTSSNPLEALLIADIDDAASPAFYGYMSLNGAWMIKKFTSGSMRYVFGVDDYPAQWTNRASLTYTLPNGA